MQLGYNEIKLLPLIQSFANDLLNCTFVKDKSGVNLIEVINYSVQLNPQYKIIDFPGVRSTPINYVNAEIDWYNSQSLDVSEISKHAKIWSDIASSDNKVNSNYGYLIYSKENGEQFENCVMELTRNPESRKGIMIYTRPTLWQEWNKDGMSDFICTTSVQYFIRKNKLNAIVNMRSNDFIYGFFNDWYWQAHVYELVYNRLHAFYDDLEYGSIFWNANSMHIYERHFDMIKSLIRLGLLWKDSMRKERRELNLRKKFKESLNEKQI